MRPRLTWYLATAPYPSKTREILRLAPFEAVTHQRLIKRTTVLFQCTFVGGKWKQPGGVLRSEHRHQMYSTGSQSGTRAGWSDLRIRPRVRAASVRSAFRKSYGVWVVGAVQPVPDQTAGMGAGRVCTDRSRACKSPRSGAPTAGPLPPRPTTTVATGLPLFHPDACPDTVLASQQFSIRPNDAATTRGSVTYTCKVVRKKPDFDKLRTLRSGLESGIEMKTAPMRVSACIHVHVRSAVGTTRC